jgi:integrase
MPRPGVKRRGFGDGSIYPLKDGRWVSYIRMPDGRKKFFTGRTRDAVKDRLQEAQRQAEAGRLPIGRDVQVATYLERWLTDAVRHSVRPKTFENYELCVRRLLPLIGRARLRTLSPEQIQFALGKLLDSGMAPRTVRQVHMVLRRALKQGVLWRLLVTNPSDAVSAPRPDRKEMRTLTEDEVRHLLTVARGMRDYGLWVFLVTTGLRLGEALALRWSDLDLKEGRATIRRAVQRQRGAGLVFVEPKSARSRRTVPIPHETIEVLEEQRRSNDRDRRKAGELWQESELVFPTPVGRPRDTAYRSISFHAALDRAGLPRMRLHDLRHTAATHLLTKQIHPKVVQDLLGHSTIAITLDTYSHVMPALAKEASSHMSGLVPSQGGRVSTATR